MPSYEPPLPVGPGVEGPSLFPYGGYGPAALPAPDVPPVGMGDTAINWANTNQGNTGYSANYGPAGPTVQLVPSSPGDYSAHLPTDAQAPSYPVDPRNLAPVPNQGGKPFPYAPVLGGAGGIAGGLVGGPVGALAGRLGGTLLGKFLENGGFNNLNIQAGGYNPHAPISRSNIPPFSPGAPAFNPGGQPGTGDHFSYQQSGSIMDTNRGGYDPSAAITNPIRPFGPGNYNPGRSLNQSSGYLGAGIAQGDSQQQAQLYARMVEGGDRGELNTTLPPNFPIGLLGRGPAGALPPPPMFAAAPLPGYGPAGLPPGP